jgi:putative ABC transport system permease protein
VQQSLPIPVPATAAAATPDNHKHSYRPTASFWESARIALDSLRKSKLRSFLTLLGIILATTTLIVVLSFVNGMNLYIANKLSDMGSDGFRVVRIAFIGDWDPKKYVEMERRNPQINHDEYEFIRDHATTLRFHRHGNQPQRNNFLQGPDMQQVELDGITAEIPAISNIEMALGRAPTESEVRRHAPVTFIGQDVNEKFFAGVDPLGKTSW